MTVPVRIVSGGNYRVEVVAHQDRAGDEPARLLVVMEAEDGVSQGELAVRAKLADLHQRFFGVPVALDSPDVNEAFELFVEIWDRKRSSEGASFYSSRFQCNTTGDHLFYEGLADDLIRFNANGGSQLDPARIRELGQGIDHGDPQHVVRTWVVTLAYLLTDYRYLYF